MQNTFFNLRCLFLFSFIISQQKEKKLNKLLRINIGFFNALSTVFPTQLTNAATFAVSDDHAVWGLYLKSTASAVNGNCDFSLISVRNTCCTCVLKRKLFILRLLSTF